MGVVGDLSVSRWSAVSTAWPDASHVSCLLSLGAILSFGRESAAVSDEYLHCHLHSVGKGACLITRKGGASLHMVGQGRPVGALFSSAIAVLYSTVLLQYCCRDLWEGQ